jgi:hypothetical protein
MFDRFQKAVNARYNLMGRGELFKVDVEDLFATYLASFPAGTDPIFRVRTEHDCNCCKQFIRRLGTLVAFDDDGDRITVWDDYANLPEPYRTVSAALAAVVHQAPIISVFRTKERQYGMDHNFDKLTEQRYDHFVGKVADKHFSSSPGEVAGRSNSRVAVFRRGLEEFSIENLDEVVDLIESNGLYRGAEVLSSIRQFRKFRSEFEAQGCPSDFAWRYVDAEVCSFRNTAIGQLFVQRAAGDTLEQAVGKYEAMVAPSNYRRSSAIVTQKMVDAAAQKLEDLGLTSAVHRRMARISDLSINDVLFVDNEVQDQLKGSISALLSSDVKKRTKPADVRKATTVTVAEFVDSVLPAAREIKVLVENNHLKNFVTLTGADGDEQLFKWGNNFAWSYDGDVADSVAERVKAAGGKIDVPLRVSLSWFNRDDLDIGATDPDGNRIYFGNKMGVLDVDMNVSEPRRDAVENLAWKTPKAGSYSVYVNNYNRRETVDAGFDLQLATRDEVINYNYPKMLADGATVNALSFTWTKEGQITDLKAHPSLTITGGSSTVSTEKWGVKTGDFVPVSAAMFSPNHWESSKKIGNRHLIFVLKDCKNPEPCRGIYNEFLRGDLNEHRKVFEVLGARTKCAPADDQLSGVGFSEGRNDSVTVMVNNRPYTITF